MTIYKVTRGNSYSNNVEETFFTSRDKAFGYIVGRYAENKIKPHAIKRMTGYKTEFCYDIEMLLNVKNCMEYNYLMNGEFFYIDPIMIL